MADNSLFSPEEIQALLLKYDRKECTAEELAQIMSWYEQLDLSEAGQAPVPGTVAAIQARDALWQVIDKELQRVETTRVVRLPFYKRSRAVAAAAVLLLLGTAAWWLFWPAASRELVAHNGNLVHTQLEDGTKVWLNAGSRLTYQSLSQSRTREVTLEGEAYFDVAKDEQRPFIIHTNLADVKVLGTAFNVRAYKTDSITEMLLVSGSIAVTVKKEGREILLREPRQKVTVRQPAVAIPGKETVQISQAFPSPDVDSVITETLWRSNKLVFNHETFGEVASRIERCYNVKIHFRDEKAKQLRFTAVFDKETIGQTMSALRMSAPFQYYISDNEIFINQ
ncbi:FecR family protein [Chitinophaga sp.]|uniref:FecR family protein n=1 Tax=Chitinophaga sp. TaxID=1869181 RepID=UPI002F94E91F